MLKQPNFVYSHLSTLPKEALAKFYLSATFGLSFIISSVAPAKSDRGNQLKGSLTRLNLSVSCGG